MSDTTKPTRILVTGGAGFIGSHLVERLTADRHHVAVIDNMSTGSPHNLRPAITAGLSKELIFDADIRSSATDDIVRWWRPETIVHLAAQSFVHASMRDPRTDLDVNVVGTARLLEAAKQAATTKVVLASSGGTVYGERSSALGLTSEQTPCKPVSFYGLSKHVGDELARLYHHHFGLNYVSLALGNVYGPRQNPHGESRVLSIFAHRLITGLDCEITGDGSAVRDYVHIHDAVTAFVCALTRGHGPINIGTGVGTSVAAAYTMLAARAQVSRPPIFVRARAGEVGSVVLNPAMAAKQLGWRATIALSQGMDELIADARATWQRDAAPAAARPLIAANRSQPVDTPTR